MTEFRRAQSELKTTFNREMQNLERETGIKELTATTFNSNSYNYDQQSTYDTTYYDSPYNSTATTTEANGASATQGAGHTALQIQGAAGSIASGQLDAQAGENNGYENAWAPYNPAESTPAAHGDSAEPAGTAQNPVHG
jgi:hypothetical protein